MDATAREEFATLIMLLSMCEQALSSFRALDSRVDGTLVGDLEKLVEHLRRELNAPGENAALR
jgi:hypothetical protein